jgi:hypothetical protein
MNSPDVWGDIARNQKRRSEENKETESKDAKTQYGFEVALIDDNSVHVRDTDGNEVAFEFPVANIQLDEYDHFVERMQNHDLPLPPIANIRLAIHKPLADISRDTPATDAPNSRTRSLSWVEHAQEHGISVDEILAMYRFAREQIYARYRLRLRDRLK